MWSRECECGLVLHISEHEAHVNVWMFGGRVRVCGWVRGVLGANKLVTCDPPHAGHICCPLGYRQEGDTFSSSSHAGSSHA